MRWWHELAAHFEAVNGLPLPESMLRKAEYELLRLCPGPLIAAVSQVVASADLMQELVDSLGMGLTWFFREKRGISKLVEAYRRQEWETGRRTMCIWSAGCSTGQEPYSIAIALLEAGAEPTIVATDLNREHLRLARLGRYKADRLGAVSAALREKYFEVEADGILRVAPALRNCVRYEMHNFATSAGPPAGSPPFDVILCRNALIYYEVPEARRIVEGLRGALRQGGTMIVGSVEESMLRDNFIRREVRQETAKISEVGSQTPSIEPVQPVTNAERIRRSEIRLNEVLLKAIALEAVGKVSESIAKTRQAIQDFPLSGAAQLAHGLNLMNAGQRVEAIDALRAARFLDSKGWLASYKLGLCLVGCGYEDEAQQSFRDTLKLIRAGMQASSSPIPGLEDHLTSTTDVISDCKKRLPILENEIA